MDGRSLLGLLRGRTPQWASSRALAVEIDLPAAAGPALCRYHGIRADGNLYVEHDRIENPETGECEYAEPAVEIEHYDLRADRHQLQNLYPAEAGSSFERTQLELRARLQALRNCSGIEDRDRGPLSGPFCE